MAQIVGADHLRGEQLRQQWRPPLSEMEGKGRFGVGGAVKAEIFLEGSPDRRCYLLSTHGTGTGKSSDSPFSQGVSTGSLCPSTVFHLADCMAYTSWFFSIHSCRES